MDTWIDAKATFDQGSRLIKEGLELIQKSLDMMENESTEIPIRSIKEGKIECERRGMYYERPYVQLQSEDDGPLPFQQPKARKRHKYQGKR